ncbi:MAG: response regulator [Lachnospiraceae bacterium]|nr:response regulator [Lachnospiraceae bacterium]
MGEKGGIGVLRVMIADDEERICKLITALVDWEALEMEVAGTARNGPEAIALAKELEPDILITDIRMPGLSGLDLIEQVKKLRPEVEIVIISGYAHFEYAQTAIKFGVGDYLLKPVDQEELNTTLQKFKERILARQAMARRGGRLFQKSERDLKRLRTGLVDQLISGRGERLSVAVIQEAYYLPVESGFFQAVWLKFDGPPEAFTEAGLAAIMEKADSILESALRSKCIEMVFRRVGSSYVGFLNYGSGRKEEVRRGLKDCLNQLKSQQVLYGPVQFSLAVGRAAENPEELKRSMYEASVIIKERLVRGNGRILDRMPEPSALHERKLLDKYLRNITHAVEVMSLEEAAGAVSELSSAAREVREVRGFEIRELIHSCASLFFSRLELSGRAEALQEFDERCEWCGTMEELFGLLGRLLETHLGALRSRHENDADRPVRLAKEYIQNHYSEPITLEEVSGHVSLNPAYFSVLFKKTEGEGFAKYLIHLRMEQAKILLRDTNEPVSAICQRVGYHDVKHFTRTFEKDTGVKPATYRKLYG